MKADQLMVPSHDNGTSKGVSPCLTGSDAPSEPVPHWAEQASQDSGFLPKQDPGQLLPPSFTDFEAVLWELPDLLAAGRARQVIEKVSACDLHELTTEAALERAMAVMSVLANAAVHETWRTASIQRVPQAIAVPWVEIADRLDRPPVLSYASHGLQNWRRIDRDGPVALGNLEVLYRFYGGLDESWFVATHVEIEAIGGDLVRSVGVGQRALETADLEALRSALEGLSIALADMRRTLQRVTENCDPYIFFNRVQPFMRGLTDVTYENVGKYRGQTFTHPGGSGAQSSLLPLADAFLGVEHANDELLGYLTRLRSYMPVAHRERLADAERREGARRFVDEQGDARLRNAYDAAIHALGEFRAEHFRMSIEYIQKPASANDAGRRETGTGGSPFVKYLKKHREETFSQALQR